MKTLFASFDCELDGTNPMQHSMRSIGVAIFEDHNVRPLRTFYATLKPQVDACVNPHTMSAFWDRFPKQWEEVNTNTIEIADAMSQFSDFLKSCSGTQHNKIIFVASPANQDWMFLKCYYEKYGPVEKYDIGFFCHDLASMLRTYIRMCRIANEEAFKHSLAGNNIYDHTALHDAIYQGVMYVKLRILLDSLHLTCGSK